MAGKTKTMKAIRLSIFLLMTFFSTLALAQRDSVAFQAPALELKATVGEMNIPQKSVSSPLWENHYDWISYQMKINMREDDEQLAFQCFVVNRTDSLIYLNLNKSGIELARVVLTPDSVILVNKLEKQFYRGDYSIMNKMFGFPLDFQMAQSILNARDFQGFANNLQKVEDGSMVKLISPQRSNVAGTISIMQEMLVGENGVLLTNDVTDLKTLRDVVITYCNYVYTPGSQENQTADLRFFSKMKININTEDVVIEADISKVKVNVPGPTSIKVPDSFTEIGSEQ